MSAAAMLVTGASGFIGHEVCRVALARGFRVRGLTRHAGRPLVEGTERAVVRTLEETTELTPALAGVEVLIHLAARVHVMRETATDPEVAFRRVNVDGTLALARAARVAGVRRLVFVSSIKVNGEATPPGHAFRETDAPDPGDAYGRSKRDAEAALRDHAGEVPEVVVVRPPLVYGPGVTGNLARLLQLIHRGVPLPLGGIDNRRSLVGVRNLAGLLCTVAAHPRAAGETFLAADGEDISTPDLVRRLAAGLGRPARLVTVPRPLLALLGQFPPARAALARLTGSLQVDATKARTQLGWAPELTLAEGLQLTARAFRSAP